MNQTKRENVVFLIRILKEYLDYAENGTIALTRNLTVNDFDELVNVLSALDFGGELRGK